MLSAANYDTHQKLVDIGFFSLKYILDSTIEKC